DLGPKERPMRSSYCLMPIPNTKRRMPNAECRIRKGPLPKAPLLRAICDSRHLSHWGWVVNTAVSTIHRRSHQSLKLANEIHLRPWPHPTFHIARSAHRKKSQSHPHPPRSLLQSRVPTSAPDTVHG